MRKLSRGATLDETLEAARAADCVVENDAHGNTYVWHDRVLGGFTLRPLASIHRGCAPITLIKFVNRAIEAKS